MRTMGGDTVDIYASDIASRKELKKFSHMISGQGLGLSKQDIRDMAKNTSRKINS